MNEQLGLTFPYKEPRSPSKRYWRQAGVNAF